MAWWRLGRQAAGAAPCTDDTIWTLARNTDGTYSPASVVNEGSLPRPSYSDITWNGVELVLIRRPTNTSNHMETLARDPGRHLHPSERRLSRGY